ncbi:GNAT family N-acetyltransferase [Kitasatospora sp. NBC_01287]|uniref:GNAT family N-acetyltransferase n=1 Tax=Kitasatospora sp. NBC_01287 TaxID=2903573 RepID=UPI002259A5D4|nr:GNAT family N-acetyltransferase [Kitasatospora sp. NBC_01287]MCX4744056.1 GNAT family N-acetyltransferase [Kitasatospora sp. NBC_01287]
MSQPRAEGDGTEVLLRVRVDDLTPADLPDCAWAGSATHLASVAVALERAAAGEVDYLALRTAAGLPVAVGGVNYQVIPGAGVLWQLGVHPALRSCGLGTLLIRVAEERIRARGLTRAELRVEESNPRARALYERLGYTAYDRRPDAWDVQAADGSIQRYETVCRLMGKDLS